MLTSRGNRHAHPEIFVTPSGKMMHLSKRCASRLFSTLSPQSRQKIQEMIRVNQAGEIGANAIYAGQALFITPSHESGPLIQHMWDQEKVHLDTFNRIVADNRIRPSILRPMWEGMGYALGAATALMGVKTAMACTEAVETVIGEHYNDQVRELMLIGDDHPEVQKLKEIVGRFRDDELGHLDIAVEHQAKDALFHSVLNAVIQAGCRVAIVVAKKI